MWLAGRASALRMRRWCCHALRPLRLSSPVTDSHWNRLSLSCPPCAQTALCAAVCGRANNPSLVEGDISWKLLTRASCCILGRIEHLVLREHPLSTYAPWGRGGVEKCGKYAYDSTDRLREKRTRVGEGVKKAGKSAYVLNGCSLIL